MTLFEFTHRCSEEMDPLTKLEMMLRPEAWMEERDHETRNGNGRMIKCLHCGTVFPEEKYDCPNCNRSLGGD